MKAKTLYLIIMVLCVLLCSCGGLEDTRDPERRDREPEGEPGPPKIDVMEFTNWRDFLKNCKPDFDTPDNISDIIAGAVPGLKDNYLPGMFRACFEKKSQDAHGKICEARDYWERKKKNARSSAQKSRAENELHKLARLEDSLNHKLYKLGTKARDQMEHLKENKKETAVGRVLNFWARDEYEGWETVLDVESYSSCTSYVEDDDDDYD